MNSNNTDRDWEHFAKEDPFWAVLTQDKFKRENFDDSAQREFFSSGEAYVNWVFETIRSHIQPNFSPRVSLDFGCGVGRLLLPIARRSMTAIGVDVSESMLAHAAEFCKRSGQNNIKLIHGDDLLTGVEGPVDFVNSFIVIQHIPCVRGINIFQRLLSLLSPGGVGALHVTYSNLWNRWQHNISESTITWPPPDRLRHHLSGALRALNRRFSAFRRPVTGAKRAQQTSMQMNSYSMNALFDVMQSAGIRRSQFVFTEHTGTRGLVLFFEKPSNTDYSPKCLFEP